MTHKFFHQMVDYCCKNNYLKREVTRYGKKFTSAELKKATKSFHDGRIIGQGGFALYM